MPSLQACQVVSQSYAAGLLVVVIAERICKVDDSALATAKQIVRNLPNKMLKRLNP